MKKDILLFVFLLAVVFAFGQAPAHVSHRMDYKGYTIMLLPSEGQTFLYDILKDNQVVHHQALNPFGIHNLGLHAADAFKVAQWQIDHLKKTPAVKLQQHRPRNFDKLPPALQRKFENLAVHPRIPLRVPQQVAMQLAINLEQH